MKSPATTAESPDWRVIHLLKMELLGDYIRNR
jgi:hypothetical protein